MKLDIQLFGSKSVSTATYDGRYLKMTVTEDSVNIPANTSKVTWKVESCGGNSTYYTIYNYGAYVNSKQVWDGTSGLKTKGWSSYEFPAKKGSKSGSVTITHSNDGTYSLPFKLYGKVSSNSTVHFDGTLTLSVIPQPPTVSGVSVDVSTVGEATVTPTITGSYSNVEYSIDNTNWQVSDTFSVIHNTEYTFYARANYTNSTGSSAWSTNSTTATTEGIAPVITRIADNITKTTAAGVYPSKYQNAISFNIDYDDNAIYDSCTFFYGIMPTAYTTEGTVTHSGASLVCTTDSNLVANKYYYYQIVLTDNFNRSTTYTGSFLTDCLPPGNVTLNIDPSSVTSSSFGGTVTAIGDTNAPVTACSIYYVSITDPTDSGSVDYVYSGASSLNQSWSFSNLTLDTTYNVYCEVTNQKGTTISNTLQVSTNVDTPVITSFTGTATDAFTINVTLVGSSPSGHTLNYAFSSDGGTTWSTYQVGNTYTFTNLNEETSYTIGGRVKALASGGGSDTYATSYITVTTPTDQARARIKINGAWQRGKVFIKQNGTWVKAKKIYYKQNGQWVVGHDND